MEVPGAKSNKVAVCFYEFIGSAVLVVAYNWTYGNTPINHILGISFTYFALYALFGTISGAHFNPALTLGVLIQKKVDC